MTHLGFETILSIETRPHEGIHSFPACRGEAVNSGTNAFDILLNPDMHPLQVDREKFAIDGPRFVFNEPILLVGRELMLKG